MDAAALGPPGGDPLDAGAAAMYQRQVGVLGRGPVEAADDGARVGDGLAAGDGDQGAGGQMRTGFAMAGSAMTADSGSAAKRNGQPPERPPESGGRMED